MQQRRSGILVEALGSSAALWQALDSIGQFDRAIADYTHALDLDMSANPRAAHSVSAISDAPAALAAAEHKRGLVSERDIDASLAVAREELAVLRVG